MLIVQQRHLHQQDPFLGGFKGGGIVGIARVNGTCCILGLPFSDLNEPRGISGRVGGGASTSAATGCILCWSVIKVLL